MTATRDSDASAGRKAYEQQDWEEAFRLLSAAGASGALSGADLEALAEAARWSRHYDEMLDAFERAHGAYGREDDSRGAARVALQLATEHYQRQSAAPAAGWHARAARLLEEDTESPEYGLLLWAQARALMDTGEVAAARQLNERVIELGRRLGNRAVEAMGLLDQGHALVVEGHVNEGMALIDEATAAALSGELDLWSTGVIYCSTIFACRNRGDWERAGQWTDASLRWCRRASVSGFPGLCRFHRAEVMRLRGELEAAERDAVEATEELLGAAPRFAAWAFHELGEIRRRRGDRAGATEAFARAVEIGFDPQPGQALLALDEGHPEAARRAIDGALAEKDAFVQEARAFLLPAAVKIAVEAGDADLARSALAELESMAGRLESSSVDAALAVARGELALYEGRIDEASRELRHGRVAWSKLEAPYEAASARLLVARSYRALDREDAARAELEAARATFARIGAAGASGQVSSMLSAAPEPGRAVATLMFTDIVDSTRLVEVLGDDAWEHLLGWHDRKLRECFEAHGGKEVKHEGDGFFVAFDNPSAAIESARSIQRALLQQRREQGFAPAVRIGVHTAEMTRRGDDYGGRGVHVTARIAAAADGGEVLASSEALAAAGDPEESSPRTLELKGLAGAVPVASVEWR